MLTAQRRAMLLQHAGIETDRLGAGEVGFHDARRIGDQLFFPRAEPGFGLDEATQHADMLGQPRLVAPTSTSSSNCRFR